MEPSRRAPFLSVAESTSSTDQFHSASAPKEGTLFDAPVELANVWLPIILLICAVIEVFWSHRLFSNETLELNFIQNIFLLNSLHVMLTYFALWSNRTGRAWAQDALGRGWFCLRCLCVFIFFTGLYYIFRQGEPQFAWMTTFIQAVLIVSGRHHEIAQSRGISLLYDSKFCDQNVFLHKLFPLTQMVQSLFGFSSALFSFLTLNTYQVESPIYDVAKHSFRSPIWHWLWVGGFIVSLACLVLLFYATNLIYPKELRKNKVLFNLRYPIKLLSYQSSLAAFFANGTHGIEYLAVYTKLDQIENRVVSKYRFIFFLSIATCLFVTLRYLYAFAPSMGLENYPGLISAGMSVIVGLTFLHYFLDAHLFKHSGPIFKSLVEKS